MAMNLRLAHIDSTFQPMFCAYPCDPGAVKEMFGRKMDADSVNKQMQIVRNKGHKPRYGRYKWRLGGIASDAGHAFPRAPLLNLQDNIDLGKRKRDDQGETDELGGSTSVNSTKNTVSRVPVHPALLQLLQRPRLPDAALACRVESSSLRNSDISDPGLREDIGVFDDAGAVAESTAVDLAVPSFTVPKPGLKAARKSGKGKGVVSSVLGADGSIRLEQSRML